MADDNRGFTLPEGIDPELAEYFVAAQEDDGARGDDAEGRSNDGRHADGESSTGSDEPDLERLQQIVRETLLAGADPDLVEAVLSGSVDEEDDPESGTSDLAGDEAELTAAAVTAVHAIYQSLLARNPEHDFDPSLVRVAEVLNILGDPQDAYPCVHVGGTNGKTSTTRMVSALLQAFGLRVGTYTSPHLLNVRERIAVNAQPVSPQEFVAAWEDVSIYIDMVDASSAAQGGPRISYFEALTIMAMAYFADVPVDVAVFEVGMGGRWDATNVVDAGVEVITPISLDHQQWLGDTLTHIAYEKAQIIKDKSIVVVCQQDETVLEVLERRALETDSVFWVEGRDWELLARTPGVGGQIIDVRTPAGLYEQVFVPLHGEHQAHNAAAALVAAEAMMGGKPLTPQIVEEGFLSVRSPGRLEVVRTSPTVVVDGAHNPAGVAALRLGLEEAFHFDVTIGLFSAMDDKNIESMLVEIEADLDEIVVVPLGGDRGAALEELRRIAEDVLGADRVHLADSVSSGIDLAAQLADAPTDPTLSRGIVAFGSIRLAGEVAGLLQR